ncbi:MAG: hypothetical protein GY820_14070 [Gammaproteobacteria bacterium]|nr:hypothetical protein [Gammaproteobacteria bacterium]
MSKMKNKNKRSILDTKSKYKKQRYEKNLRNHWFVLGNGNDLSIEKKPRQPSAIINEATDAVRKKMPLPSNQKWAHEKNGCDLNDELAGCTLETNYRSDIPHR